MNKKIICIIAVLIITMLMIPACGKKGASADDTADTSTAVAKTEEDDSQSGKDSGQEISEVHNKKDRKADSTEEERPEPVDPNEEITNEPEDTDGAPAMTDGGSLEITLPEDMGQGGF